ncbi:AlkA N-terminal domain-containing protein [Aeromonas caviae]|uniref:AlkA N-terminal domain-containing protein n=1 Tax=Aeromonas caviae TaxID=648 RepID=UPI0029DCA524|nr:AlkA N-terminal domain-containing protein [Aeromonas caviae]MDX7809736.1 AlkA N-terminal domain-containing protein [Aeromonas caviae]MDX7886744.1 AlkA N-terminal domain-containing protein [Aeromonas caviae]
MTTEPPHSSQRDEIIPGLTREQCHAARLARDTRFDGRFFTGVLSTGIYCRPVCPARAPHEHNVRYFRFAAAAEQHGLRPCLRCRPELAPAQSGDLPPLVAQVLARIERGELAEHSLGSLATQAGITERTLRRQFEQHLGASPKQVEQTRRLLLAKRLLTETRLPITDVAFAAGFASIRRFNDAWLQAYGMTPGALRKQEGGAPQETPQSSLQLHLLYRPPFDVQAMLAFYRLRAIPGLERVDEHGYERRHRVGEQEGLIRIEPVEGERLRLTVRDLPPGALPDILYRVRRMWDLDADMGRIGEHLGQDPLLAGIQGRWPGVRLPGGWDEYEVMLRAIVGQQVSVKGAITIMGRLVARTLAQFGTAQLPTPTQLCELDLDGIGMPGSRIRTLQGLAAALASGALTLGSASDEQLLALPGIGPWTVAYWRLRCGLDTDAFPASDLVLQKALGGGDKLPVKEVTARSAPWQPWRAYAASWLWHAMSEQPALLTRPTQAQDEEKSP